MRGDYFWAAFNHSYNLAGATVSFISFILWYVDKNLAWAIVSLICFLVVVVMTVLHLLNSMDKLATDNLQLQAKLNDQGGFVRQIDEVKTAINSYVRA